MRGSAKILGWRTADYLDLEIELAHKTSSKFDNLPSRHSKNL